MHEYGINLRLEWNWKLYRKHGFKRMCNNHGYWTDWFTPILPGLYLVNSTEGPP